MAEPLFKYNIYGDLLHSEGYSVDFAMGTTYSLDLESLIGVPLSFGLLGDMGDSFMKSPLYILESIRKSSDKIVLFCNSAGISVPKKQQLVYSLLEKSIFEVKQDGSFHPKIWFIKESNDRGDTRVKIIVSSRNLTFDNSIDMVVSFCGNVSDKQYNRQKHLSLVNYIKGIAKYASPEKTRKINELCQSINGVWKFEVDNPFEDYDFFPISPEFGHSLEDMKKFIFGKDCFIVSPFIDAETLKWMTRGCRKKSLVTRRLYIDREIIDLFNGEVYAVNEKLLSDMDNRMDIHAKMYFIHKREQGESTNYLFIGSANATKAAFDKNTEFLLRLKFKPMYASYNKVVNEFLNDVENKYIRIDTPIVDGEDAEEDSAKEEEKVLKEVIGIMEKAVVKKSVTDQSQYSIILSLKKEPMFTSRIFISPLQCTRQRVRLEQTTCFDAVLLKELSEFYIIEVEKLKRVVKIKTRGIPESRDEQIYKSIVDTPEKFINYVSFMLSEDPQLFIYENENYLAYISGNDGKFGHSKFFSTLYEDMLHMAYTSMDRLKDIEELVRKVDKSIIPDEFNNMYKQFKKALRLR